MNVRYVWGLEYVFEGQARTMLLESSSNEYSFVETTVHPSIRAKGFDLRYIGEATSV